MDVSEPTLNRMLKGHMKYMTERQQVVAQNIANIDTPGFKARDLKKVDFANMAAAESSRLAMVTTSPKHIAGTLGNGGTFTTVQDRDTFETAPTQNNVVLEDQMGKISDTNAQYQLSSSMLKKYTQLYRAALGNR